MSDCHVRITFTPLNCGKIAYANKNFYIFLYFFDLQHTKLYVAATKFTAEVEAKGKKPVQTIYSRSRSRKAVLVFVLTTDVKRTPRPHCIL